MCGQQVANVGYIDGTYGGETVSNEFLAIRNAMGRIAKHFDWGVWHAELIQNDRGNFIKIDASQLRAIADKLDQLKVAATLSEPTND